MTRLVLHVGDCKSGSTAIQSVLQAGSYDSDVPLLYPDAGRRGALNHHRLSNALFMARAKAWQAKAWGAVAQEVRDAPLAVLSSERFEFADPAVLLQVLHSHFGPTLPDLHIVIYIRPHIDRIVSGYVQNVKQGIFGGTMAQFIDKMAQEQRFHFAPRLARWQTVFAGATLTIRPMIRAELRENCVVRDFLHTCLAPLGGTATVRDIPMANASLSAPALEIVRQMWDAAGPERDPRESPKAAALAQFTQALENADPYAGDKVAISATDARAAQALYAQDAADCDAQVFGHAVMVPALQAAVEAAPLSVRHAAPTPEVAAISAVWLDTVDAMMRQSAQTRPKKQGRATAAHATAAQWHGARTP